MIARALSNIWARGRYFTALRKVRTPIVDEDTAGNPDDRPSLIQFWHANPRGKLEQIMETWRTAEKEGFVYRRYDDKSALQFIRKNYGSRVENAYRACAVPAMRADILRICALLIYPGIYVDADTRRAGLDRWQRKVKEERNSLSDLFARVERGVLFKRENRVANGFILVRKPQDPLMKAILARAVQNVEGRISNNVFVVTGPGIATKWLNELGAEHEYFRGFNFLTMDELKGYMRMGVGKLDYKNTNDHWVNAQRHRSIFIDDEGEASIAER